MQKLCTWCTLRCTLLLCWLVKEKVKIWETKKWNLWDTADMCWTAVHWKHRHHKFLRWHLDSWTYTGVCNVANLLCNAKHLDCSVNSDQRCSWNSCISAFYLQWSILLQMRFIMLNISSALWTVDTLSLYWSLLRRMRRFSWDLTYSIPTLFNYVLSFLYGTQKNSNEQLISLFCRNCQHEMQRRSHQLDFFQLPKGFCSVFCLCPATESCC